VHSYCFLCKAVQLLCSAVQTKIFLVNLNCMFVPDCAPYFRNGAQCIVHCFAYPLLQSLPELVISRLVQAAICPQKRDETISKSPHSNQGWKLCYLDQHSVRYCLKWKLTLLKIWRSCPQIQEAYKPMNSFLLKSYNSFKAD